ncbi:YcaO-like family protein [Mesorhizobium sp. AR02]|uniref:YcaO-like family protein n=1 Tax=Mesorhizobium sp. AR02 TaxID=2865837 RepID=UPI002160307F|nr:YcaO-like family protein [Mesorhizobium sp. AR02]UVK51403.1 YcaO-like family protein [Mesorhizobium sp. AR02]
MSAQEGLQKPMNGNFDLLHLVHGDAPAEFTIAMRECAGKAEILGSGRGLTREAAMASCLGEAAERAAASRIDTLRTIHAGANDLPGIYIAPNRFWHFSKLQLRSGPHPSESISASAWLAAQGEISNCSRWCVAKPIGAGPDIFVPLVNVVLGEGPTGTNGLAAGVNRSDARATALLELVERDAVAVWWYGRIRRPAVSLEKLDERGGLDLRRWLERRERRTWLLDITNDLGIPVVAAISAEQNGSRIAYGYSAHRSFARAGLSAVLEMLQSELSLALAEERALRSGRPEGPAGRFLEWSRSASVARLPHLLPCAEATVVAPVAPATSDLCEIVALRTGEPVVFVDLDVPGDGFKIVRALVPCLRPWRPRFQRGRLQAVPLALGWSREEVDETCFGDDVILI